MEQELVPWNITKVIDDYDWETGQRKRKEETNMKLRYRVSQRVTMQWYIEAESIEQARELAEDLDESNADAIWTPNPAVIRVSDCKAHTPFYMTRTGICPTRYWSLAPAE